jgi:hypothetical protein
MPTYLVIYANFYLVQKNFIYLVWNEDKKSISYEPET